MERRAFIGTLASGLLAAPLAVEAQPAQKIYRIGVLSSASRNTAEHAVKAFDEGLRELGYEEGRNAVIERRFADGQLERLPALAAELVRLKVDVIVTGSNPSIDAVKKATTTIPVVMGLSRDPVGAGFIASLSRPAGNITGLTNDPAPDMLGKNLELLKEAAPRISRIAYLWNPLPSSAEAYRSAAESAARKLGLRLQFIAARRGRDLDDAFSSMARERADGLMVQVDPVFFSARSQLVLLAAKHRLPAVYGVREFAEAGGLMSYGTNIAYQFRRAATYVDKILKGAKPADLPVEQPTKFELVINMKTAKALGLTIPPLLLQRADQVIE
jgi:putative tryptophan/tyrosine transport system substrate-binding protein